MNCATHNTVAAVAYCRTCGKPLCAACARDVRGTKFCEQCLAERIGDALPAPPAPGAPVPPTTAERLPSPGLAAVLGFIPGVGAMYNGQFMKGFAHVMAFVCLIWMADHFGPIMIPIFFAYFFCGFVPTVDMNDALRFVRCGIASLYLCAFGVGLW